MLQRNTSSIARAPARARRVLVVDDSDDMRELVRRILGSEGYEVVEADHGASALSHLRSAAELPGLVVLDLEMPVMDGWTFLEQLRGTALADIPVLVMSATDTPRLPFDVPFLRKPATARALLAAVADEYRVPSGDPAASLWRNSQPRDLVAGCEPIRSPARARR